jgi:hypothetical protein
VASQQNMLGPARACMSASGELVAVCFSPNFSGPDRALECDSGDPASQRDVFTYILGSGAGLEDVDAYATSHTR